MREILAKRALFAIVLAACGSQRAASDVDGGRGDALPGCYVAVEFDPPMPLAYPGSRVRATAQVTGANGVPTYTWHIHRASGAVVPFTSAAPDMSAVEFDSDVADVYEALVQVSGSSTGPCLVQPWMVNVAVPGANTTQVRLRVFPPTSIAAPPTERLALVSGGATSSIGTIAIDPGVVVTGTTGAHAYLRFMPAAAPDATVETFAAADGTFTARVLHQPHDVLIVPLVAGFAPRLVTGWLPGSNLPVEMGTEITGVVRDPQNAPVAGAKVQLAIGGVPSTLATTDAAGAFTLRSSASVGTSRIEVTPPASTGLPRLVATGSFDLGQPVQVRYAAMAIRDLAGATVRRAGVVQPNANVTIVGTLANAGTIGAGANVAAIGEVRVSAMANANGVVPTLRAPDALLAAVVTRDDTTYSTVDLRTTTPATIEAPPLTEVITQLRNATNAPLGGAVFEAVPTGTFAMAGAGSVRVVADASGAITARLAPGAPYDVQLSDPRGHELGRLAAPRTIVSLTPAQMTASYTLPKALQLKGTLSLTGNPIGNARVQILCVTCTGTAREIPLAESSSSAMGAFSVAVGDPGTM